MNKLKTMMIAAATVASAFTLSSAQAATIACVDATNAVCNFDGTSGGWDNLEVAKKTTIAQAFSLMLNSEGLLDVAVGSTDLDLIALSFGGVTLSGITKGTAYSFYVTPSNVPQLLTVTMKNRNDMAYGYSGQLNFTGFGAVPEPATWGLMIAGFGLTGGALRRRRTARAAIA